MRRRDFISGLGGAAAASALWPLTARAQQPAMPVIGFLDSGSTDAQRLAGFREGLKEAGYVEGQNVAVEYRWANGQMDRLPALAADLVRRRVAVILATGGYVTVLPAKEATSSIPIVFAGAFDPVPIGLVASWSRPGGNVTGVTVIAPELVGKRLDLLLQWIPEAMTVAFLAETSPLDQQMSRALAAARTLGRQFVELPTRNERDIEAAFATLVERKVGALLVGVYPLLFNHREEVVALAARHKIPAIYGDREFAAAGGLMSYGGNYRDATVLGAVYVGRILKGDKPVDLPVQQTTKFELVLNLKAAKALGRQVPPHLLALADEVIE